MLQRSIPAGFIAPWEDWSGEQHPAASDPHIALGLSDDRNGSRPGRGDGSGISRQVRTGRRERQTILILIKGLAEGVAWADASNQARGVARLYCPSRPLFFSAARAVDGHPPAGGRSPSCHWSRAVAAGHDRSASKRISLQAATRPKHSALKDG